MTWHWAKGMRWSFYVAIITFLGYFANKKPGQRLFLPDLRCWIMIALAILIVRYVNGTIGLGRLLRSLVPYGAIWLAPYGLWMGTRGARFQRITRVMLQARRCPHCGYDLRGTLAAGRTECPECGATAPPRPAGPIDHQLAVDPER